MLAPVANGNPVGTVSEELIPPPCGCDGEGIETPSTANPITFTLPAPVTEIDWLTGDVMARKSAVPTFGAGAVVMSINRNLNRVTGWPVLFM